MSNIFNIKIRKVIFLFISCFLFLAARTVRAECETCAGNSHTGGHEYGKQIGYCVRTTCDHLGFSRCINGEYFCELMRDTVTNETCSGCSYRVLGNILCSDCSTMNQTGGIQSFCGSCGSSTVTDVPTSTPRPTNTPVPTSTPVPASTSTPTPSPTLTPSCKSLSELRAFTYQTSFLPWWQTIGGDVHADGEISSAIPSCATNTYLSLPGSGDTAGIISYGTTLSLGQGQVSENSWQARTAYTGPRVNFDYLVHRLKVDDRVNTFDGNMPSESGTYYFNGNKDLTGSFPTGSNKKIIIFVEGNVNVAGDIIVPDNNGSFFALIVKGNLNFKPSVGSAQGIYVANGTITIESGSTQFKGEGSFIAWTDVSLERDLGTGNNNCTPAHLFTQRPDLLVNAPSTFKIADSYFKEVAP